MILDDCHLTLAEGIYENIFRNENMYTDIGLKLKGAQHGIRIIGRGEAVLDGGKGNDLRLGCSDILVENITDRTGDDVVAISAFPKGTDSSLVPENGGIDIHDITIRNVRAYTRQSIVAIRNHDGAKVYRVSIENIADVGGEYGPWGIVRIGECNYYMERVLCLGETNEINVRGVYSLRRGTVYLGASLKDSYISDIYAGDVTMENVVFSNIHYNGTAEDGDDPWIKELDIDIRN